MKFDALKEKDNIVKFIREYYKKNNLGGVVIGISGGKDSGVVAGLFTEALGKENVVGFTLPCHSKEEDRSHAKLVSDFYGFELYNFDLTKVKGKGLVTNKNGIQAQYMETLNQGDVIELYWMEA